MSSSFSSATSLSLHVFFLLLCYLSLSLSKYIYM
uniref:Uncharacterized protein n=1 Tax=Musa acuminata subsp. malaccensis TaxID=214687 RepID=A0A804K6C2_MUSAM